ncbi:MAG: queuosine precursor transporter [Petrotogales bacterium]
MKLTVETKTNILYGLFVGSLIAANLIGLKIADFILFEASVGILLFPILFLITDIIEEVHGRKKTKELVFVGMITLVVVLIVTVMAVLLLFAQRSMVKEEYTTIFATTIRIFIASITAFVISQLHDVWAFNFWKQKTKGKHLWLRNNLSTVVSQFLDTTLFMFIAFYYITPKFTVYYVFTLIIPYWLVKVLFALFDTPFCYLGVRWLKGSEA